MVCSHGIRISVSDSEILDIPAGRIEEFMMSKLKEAGAPVVGTFVRKIESGIVQFSYDCRDNEHTILWMPEK